jgi:diadenosine tetraphosphate (Ap4A) HIT family hydrolase
MGSLLSKCAFSAPIDYTTADALALQHVDHVHFHVIPKPSETEGLRLTIGENWPMKKAEPETLAATCEKMKANFD